MSWWEHTAEGSAYLVVTGSREGQEGSGFSMSPLRIARCIRSYLPGIQHVVAIQTVAECLLRGFESERQFTGVYFFKMLTLQPHPTDAFQLGYISSSLHICVYVCACLYVYGVCSGVAEGQKGAQSLSSYSSR